MDSSEIIDSHLHLIYRDRLSYPWLAGFASLNRDFPYEQYGLEARRCGVTGAIHMEVNVVESDIEAETGNIMALAADKKSLQRGAISACRPESRSFPAFLERELDNLFVKGFRRVLHVVPDETSLAKVFRDNLRLLSGSGRPFDLCVRPDQIDKAIALADLAPEVQFVLDHCGIPAIKERAEHPWRESVADIARRPNVAVKISGVVAYADPASWTVDDIRPYVEHAIESFGWDRVVWGSDWPVCTLTASLSLWLAAIQAITAACTAGERRRLFSANARRLWRLPD